ncbi:cilia- and flagella-associated protein 65-like [Belonocnema kinseyi]|uniref:cilia- and flagella-associated protein 65-like n=1 Tax=Belonocnema kinseyi TaxID=2817044 RepID=UPI00143D8266|nr:cilia- and flagella-associated protein 65-like [Belonocnema kinseyi]
MTDCNFDTNVKIQNIHVDFGKVEVGCTAVRTIKVVNRSDVDQSYKVQRDEITNSLDYVFNLKEYFWILSPGREYVCDISYRPIASFCKNTDYFTISDNDENYCYKIVVQGISIGPCVLIEKSRLLFHTSEEIGEIRKRIKITNESIVPAIFLFDLDENQSPFKLSLTNGTIKPSSFIYIYISFVPLKPGIQVYYLPCLILNQKPITIELYGYFGSVYTTENEFSKEICSSPLPKIAGYEGYICDVTNIRRGTGPLISLSNNFIDFGQSPVGTESSTRRIPQTVCFQNHSPSNLLVIWEEVVSGIFKINPHSTQVGSKQSSIFEISFDPLEEKSLYSHEILLKAFRKQEKVSSFCQAIPTQSTIPLITSLRMIGHSLRLDSSKDWIPHYQVPQTVIMPACIPAIPVYTNFLIRKLESQMPLMFRFIPPEVSNFTIKPALGIIYKDYQVVTVEMFPENEGENLYFERWSLRFNDCQETETHIDFRGYAEYPNLNFEIENRIEFDPTYPDSCRSRKVSVRNPTRHCIKFSFLRQPKELKIHYDNDIIHPNEILSQEWIFCPAESGYYNFTLDCKVIALDNENLEVDSPSRNIEISVSGIGEKGRLVAIPNELNYEELAFQNSKSLSFHLFNFSRTPIHFQMSSQHRNWPIGCLQRDVKIIPTIGTILPQGNEKIEVTITPQEAGFYEFFIQYFVKSDSEPKSPVLKDEPKKVCSVNCMSVYPTFIIEDLLYYGPEAGVSKFSLWKLMQINKLNNMLRDLHPNSIQTLNMNFPVFTTHNKPLHVELLLTNPQMVPVSWTLKRIKLCSCGKKYKTKSFSFQCEIYDCPHREVVNIFPKSGTIKPRKEARISIEIRYNLLGTTELQWDLIFEKDRRVTLKTKVRSLSENDEELILFQEPPLKFEQVYIGDLNPINQMVWIYNPTKLDISYQLDMETLNKINEQFGGPIFSCSNPSGSLKGLSHYPIIFKYHPRQFQEYSIRIPIKLGKRETELILEGASSQNSIIKVAERLSPYKDKFFIPEVPVYFNTDSITISPVSTNSTITRVIIIHNRHPKDVLGYSWERYKISEIIEAKVEPSNGRIPPLTTQTFLLTVFTGSESSKITICVTCKFINMSEKHLYEKETLSLFEKSKELENEFIITEKGIQYPKDKLRNPKNLKPPVPFYKGLTVQAYVYKENLNASGFTLECMIWDILNSNVFQNMMQEKLAEKSKVMPQMRNIETLLRKMTFRIVHENYELVTNHLLEPSDFRQLTYKKISTDTQEDHAKLFSIPSSKFTSFSDNKSIEN